MDFKGTAGVLRLDFQFATALLFQRTITITGISLSQMAQRLRPQLNRVAVSPASFSF